MMAITKTKQLLNELSYLVMASTANAFISLCSVVCVARFASVHSRANLHSQSIALSTPALLFSSFFTMPRIPPSLASAIDILMTQIHLPKTAKWPCRASVCHRPDLTPHPAALSASHLPLSHPPYHTLAFSGQWDGLGYHGDRTNRETSCQECFSVLALPPFLPTPIPPDSLQLPQLVVTSGVTSATQIYCIYMFVVVECVCVCVWMFMYDRHP